MNKHYKVIWDPVRNTYVVASELAKSKTQSASSSNQSGMVSQLKQVGQVSILAAALGLVSTTVFAGAGIFINDGTDNGCLWTYDQSERVGIGNYNGTGSPNTGSSANWGINGRLPTVTELGGTGNQMCVATDKDTQTNRVLFYGNSTGKGSTSLTLGGRLDVNSGVIGVGDRANNDSIRIGGGTSLTATAGAKALVLGYNSQATATDSIALGNSAKSNVAGGVALGAKSVSSQGSTSGHDVVANGASSNTSSTWKSTQGALAIGDVTNNITRQITGVAAGSNDTDAVNLAQLKALSDVSVKYDDKATKNKITLEGGANGTVISNVQAGQVHSTSKDAINGSQLYTVSQSVSNALGGGSVINVDGSVSSPSYKIGGNNFNNVGGALENLDNRVTNINNDLNTGIFSVSANGENNAVKVGKGATINFTSTDANVLVTQKNDDFGFGLANSISIKDTVKVGNSTLNQNGLAITNGPSITVNGIDANYTNITNVADGIDDGDAVNKKQLDQLETDLTDKGYWLSSNTGKINEKLGGEISVVGGATTKGTYSSHNMQTALDSDGSIVVQIAEKPVFAGVQAGSEFGNLVVIDENGIKINNAATPGKNITLSDSNVSFGGNVINDIAAGNITQDSKQAVNGGQLYNVSTSVADALGGGSVVNPDGSVSAPSYVIGGDTFNNVGGALSNLDGRVTQNTDNITTNTNNITQLGEEINAGVFSVSANGEANAVKVGKGETIDLSNTDNNIVIKQTGNDFEFGLANSISIAQSLTVGGNTVLNDQGLSINNGPSVTVDGIDAGSKTINNVGTASEDHQAVNKGQMDEAINDLNANTQALSELAVKYDDSNKDRITLAGSNGTVIDGLQDGLVAEASQQAVNGGQLYNVSTSVADALGGGSVVNPDGSVSAPSYVIGGDTFNNVGGALSNLDGRVTQNSDNITNNANNITQLGNELNAGVFSVSANGETNAVKVGKGETIDFSNTDSNIVIKQTGNDFEFGLANSISIAQSLTVGGNTVLNDQGLSINNGPSVTVDGIDAGSKTINNVGTASEDHQAVNKGQMDEAINDLNANTQALSALAVKYEDSNKDRITLAGSNGTVIDGLQDGLVAEASQQAVNGGQLYNVSTSVADALGGGSVVNQDGSISAPSYVIGGDTFNNVGGALTNLDNRVTQNSGDIVKLDNRVTNVENQVNNIESQVGDLIENTVTYDDSSKNDLSLKGDDAQISQDKYGNDVVNSGGTVIHNVGNGVHASDAVNKGQLDASLSEAKGYTDQRIEEVTGGVSQDLTEVKNSINTINQGGSGMFQVNQNGSLTAPTPTGDNAVAGGSGAVASGKNSIALGHSAKATADNSVALGADSVADRDNSVSIGSEGNERQLTNVAAGTERTDAVNIGQLSDALGNIGQGMGHLNKRINDVEQNSNAGVAAAMAMATLPQVTGAGESGLSMSVGTYQSETGYALGYSAVSDGGNWVFKAAASGNSQGKFGASAGVLFKLR